MNRPVPGLLILLTFLGATACTSLDHPKADYQTIPDPPGRDRELAAKGNAQAVGLIDGGKYEKAEAKLKEALIADVTFGPAHNNLGKIYYHQGRYYLAAWEFEYAARLMPHHPEPRNNLGLVFEKVGRLDEAVDHYAEVLALEPDNPQVLGNLVRARIRRGDKDEEIRELLNQVVIKDTRLDWRNWALRKLALMPPSSDSSEN